MESKELRRFSLRHFMQYQWLTLIIMAVASFAAFYYPINAINAYSGAERLDCFFLVSDEKVDYLSGLADGKEIGELHPEKRNYDSVQNMTMTEAAIVHLPIEDVYVSLATPTSDGNGWVVRAYVKPFVMFIWYGTLLMALGGLLALTTRRGARFGGEAK